MSSYVHFTDEEMETQATSVVAKELVAERDGEGWGEGLYLQSARLRHHSRTAYPRRTRGPLGYTGCITAPPACAPRHQHHPKH